MLKFRALDLVPVFRHCYTVAIIVLICAISLIVTIIFLLMCKFSGDHYAVLLKIFCYCVSGRHKLVEDKTYEISSLYTHVHVTSN